MFRVEQFCSVKDADIEDLFTPDEYLSIYNATFGKPLEAGSLPGSDRIVKRIERVGGPFDHGRVAAHFLANQHDVIGRLSSDTVKRFENLIEALVKVLPPIP